MSTWARFVTGVEQAIETLRNEADARLRQEQEPAKPNEPGTNILNHDEGASQTDRVSSLEQATNGAGRKAES